MARGQADRAASIRRRQEEALRDKERYRRLLIADRGLSPVSELRERARLAERLGRWFEAQGWLKLILNGNPEAREALDRLRARKDPAPASLPIDEVSEGRAGAASVSSESSIAAIAFRDDAGRAGLRFTYDNGETPQHQIPETIGGGVAVLDYDGDGRLDAYLVQGGIFPPDEEGERSETTNHTNGHEYRQGDRRREGPSPERSANRTTEVLPRYS